MRTGLRGIVGFVLTFGVIGTLQAEQITSTCRITVVDAVAHTVTLVRKTPTGEKTGVAKVADAGKVTIDGEAGSLASLTPPVDVTVVFDTVTSSVVEIRVAKSMTKTGPAPTGTAPPLAIAPFGATKAKEHQEAWAKYYAAPVQIENSLGMKLVLIPAGEFQMGSPPNGTDQHDDEFQHRVRITEPFYFGVYEVTQAEYTRVMGTNPSFFAATGRGKDKVQGQDTARFPVEQVSWDDAAEFCRKLSATPEEQRAGRVYRLPTEAEWEFACRAGTTTEYCFGNDASQLGGYAWLEQNASTRTHLVGQKQPNAWGLHDMHGNVWEWCQDGYGAHYYKSLPADQPPGPLTASYRVFRGGGWRSLARVCRAASRYWFMPSLQDYDLGFRVALVPSSR